jgi:PIN domain nuclease of toxin-antitoxin system
MAASNGRHVESRLSAGVGRRQFPTTLCSLAPTRRKLCCALIHHDPFERLLIAQALSEPLILLTADAALRSFGPVIQIV